MSNDDEKISDGLWLFKRPNSSIWWVRIKEAGEWNRYTTKETDKAKARTAAILLMGRGQGLAQAGRTAKGRKFEEASKLYIQHLDDLEKKGNGKPSHANYRLYVRKWIDPFFKSKRIDAISHEVINEWELWRRELQLGEIEKRLEKKFGENWRDNHNFDPSDVPPLSRSSIKGMHSPVQAWAINTATGAVKYCLAVQNVPVCVGARQ